MIDYADVNGSKKIVNKCISTERRTARSTITVVIIYYILYITAKGDAIEKNGDLDVPKSACLSNIQPPQCGQESDAVNAAGIVK